MAQDKENRLPYVYVDIDQAEPPVSHIYNDWTHPAPGYKNAQSQQAKMYDVNAQYPSNQGRIEMEADPSSPVIPLVVPVFHKVVEHDYSPQPHSAQHARQAAQSYQQSYQQPATIDPANSAEAYLQNQMTPEHQQLHIKKAQHSQQVQQAQQSQQSQQAQQPQQTAYELQPQPYQQPAVQSQPSGGLYMNEQENADQLEIQPYQPQYAWYSPYGYPYADPYGYGYGYDAYAQYPQYAPPQVYQQPQPYGQPYPQDYGQQYSQPYGQPYPQDYSQPYPQPYGQQYPSDYGQPYPQDYGQQYQSEYNSQAYPQNYNYAYQQPYASGYGYPQQGIPGAASEMPAAQPYTNEPQRPQHQASHGAHASMPQSAQQPSANQQSGLHQQPASDAFGSSNDEIGAPLLDQQAIQDSPIFDEPPVPIADGMKTLEDGHKKRKRLLIVSLIALAVVAIALVVVLFILIGGSAGNQTANQTAATTSSSSAQTSSQSSAAFSSKSSAASTNKSGTVVYQYSANTTSGVQYSVKETVTFQSNGDCEFSTMELTFPDEASATEYVTNLARDYGSNFTLDSQSGPNAVVTIDNSGLHLDRDEYENALRYSVEDLVILKK